MLTTQEQRDQFKSDLKIAIAVLEQEYEVKLELGCFYNDDGDSFHFDLLGTRNPPKLEPKLIYIVVLNNGKYEAHDEWNSGAFADYEIAVSRAIKECPVTACDFVIEAWDINNNELVNRYEFEKRNGIWKP